jgi:hypothetical protein
MGRDEDRIPTKAAKCGAECRVSFVSRGVETVVRGHFSRRLPNRLDRVELGRIRRQTEKRDAVRIVPEPLLAFVFKIVTRPIVDNEKDLAWRVLSDEVLEELQNVCPLNTSANWYERRASSRLTAP